MQEALALSLSLYFPLCLSIGCKSFVKIEYDSNNVTLHCVFTNSQSNVSDSVRSCSVRYGKCGPGGELLSTMSTLSNESSNNIILLQLKRQYVEGGFCYTITANNGTYTIIVEGRIGKLWHPEF